MINLRNSRIDESPLSLGGKFYESPLSPLVYDLFAGGIFRGNMLYNKFGYFIRH